MNFLGLWASRKPQIYWKEYSFFPLLPSPPKVYGFLALLLGLCSHHLWYLIIALFINYKTMMPVVCAGWHCSGFPAICSPLLRQHFRPTALPQEESEKMRDIILGAVTVCKDELWAAKDRRSILVVGDIKDTYEAGRAEDEWWHSHSDLGRLQSRLCRTSKGYPPSANSGVIMGV